MDKSLVEDLLLKQFTNDPGCLKLRDESGVEFSDDVEVRLRLSKFLYGRLNSSSEEFKLNKDR